MDSRTSAGPADVLQGDVVKDVIEEETPSPKETDGNENAPSGSQLPMLHDSMVTVRLSEPPTLTVDTRTNILAASKLRVASTPISPSKRDFDSSPSPSPISEKTKEHKADDAQGNLEVPEEDSPRITMVDPNGIELVSPMSPVGLEYQSFQDGDAKRDSDVSEESEAGEVNWEELEKTEEKEPRSESSDDVSIRMVVGHAYC